ncbi:FAD-binding oxidoreductase [Candidatus Margulisiibacteriota bacterium]
MQIKNEQDMIKDYLEDSSNLQGGYCEGVYLPEEENEVIEIVKENKMIKRPLTISGAGTGTVGGRIPFGGWVLSTEKMKETVNVDLNIKTAVFQPGITIEEIDNVLKDTGLMYAPDPTEKTAALGGTIATNASGARGLRYGSTRDHVNRIKVVTGEGKVLDISRGEKFKNVPNYLVPDVKTSAGYYLKPHMDLIDLFIGSEGTLGIITEIEVNLVERPVQTFCFIAFLDSEDAALNFANDLALKDDVISIEYFDKNTLEMLRPKYNKIPNNASTALYIEQAVKDSYLDFWDSFFKKHKLSEKKAWMGTNKKQQNTLWEFRHAIPETINELYKAYRQQKVSLDMSVPTHRFRELVKIYNTNLDESRLFYIKFGHIGESHLHVNILPKNDEEIKKAQDLSLLFVTRAISMRGSISAEHGVGKLKHSMLNEMYHEGGILGMIKVKKKFDPALILGLDNIFPRKLFKR